MTDVLTAQPDLTACDREPIHIPGAIQPHGVLLVIDAGDGRIVQASVNAAELLGVPLERILGSAWHTLLSFDTGIDDDGERPSQSPWRKVDFPQRPTASEQNWNASIHRGTNRWQIEIEPLSQPFDEDPARAVHDFTRRLDKDTSVARAADRLARTVRTLFGYDRVMVYRFDTDWHGEVIAEARRETLEAYLGLHYPHTDIPAQARALYLRNRVRQISDVGYRPVPIEPVDDPRTGAPTDLSDVSLRAVSPVHIEYLGNMGVTGTLVASIILGGRLWGLISCHHYSPLFADQLMRASADALARAFAQRVDAIEELAKVEAESVLLTVREKLITAFDESERIDAQVLGSMAPELLEVVDADGVAVFDGQTIIHHGHLPADGMLRRIREAIGHAVPDADVWHTATLTAQWPEFDDGETAGTAAGVIFMPLAADVAVLWTRREQVRSVRWAGNPHLAKLEVIPGARLSPRHSFSAWQETVRGRSRPWAAQHLESARALRQLIETFRRTL